LNKHIQVSMRKFLFLYGPMGVLTAFLFGSCVNTRETTLMQGQFDTTQLSKINLTEPVIQKGDILGIAVFSDNAAATSLFNQAPSSVGGSGSGVGGAVSSPGSGAANTSYLVDINGNIQFPVIGQLHVEGETRLQLKDSLDSRLSVYLKNPYYTIRFLNARFTMLGEVNHPGVFVIPTDKVTLLEALGMAGDLTFYGRRDNVMFIRQNNGKREFARLDLRKPEILSSPYFYLQQNDVVIVEASKRKAVANDQVTMRNITIGATIISTIAILYSIFHNN
jgi:polysaccharide export outer membrane protein